MSNLRYRYQTVEFGKIDIHLRTLRNTQEFYDLEGVAQSLGISSASWSIFGIVWPSSLVLAHYVADFDTNSKRVLEVGCGIGLSSLLLNKQQVDITATDCHPEAEAFLKSNALLNGDNAIAFERLDWAANSDELGVFDVIIGSDLLYEDEHCALLPTFIGNHSRSSCEVIIVDPGRWRKNKLIKRMQEFGFNSSQVKLVHTDYLEKDFKGHILLFER